jgi:nitrate/TMAO reductase-like tetraheme cytochrome c subunit
MDIHVYDTYVKAADGHVMHFDVFTAEKDDQKAISYAKQWLATIGEDNARVSSNECRFCHSQSAPADVVASIQQQGYFIYKMAGCPS